MELVNPVAPETGKSRALSGRIDELAGKTIGFWYNNWNNYANFLDQIETRFIAQGGVRAVTRQAELPRHSFMPAVEIDALVARMDGAVVGLGA